MTASPVLVVDDDRVSRHMISEALTRAEIPHLAVGSGVEALKQLATTRPSLVLLDLIMPPPGGYEVLRILRAHPEMKDVPVVALTALEAEGEIARAFSAGADDFLRKPFKAVELIARVRGQFRLRRVMEDLEKKERDAQVVLELTQALASNLEFRGILFGVVQRIAQVAQIDRASVVLAQDGGNTGYVVAASDDEHLRDLPIDLTKYPEIQDVLVRREALIIHDAETHPLMAAVRANPSARAFRALAILPILFENRPTGVLFLRSKDPFTFGDHEIGLFKTVSNAMAIALRNARILQSLRDQTQKVTVERVEAEAQLQTLQRYADFFESAADGILVLDKRARPLFSNAKAHEITGYAEEELRQRPITELLAIEDTERLKNLQDGFAQGAYPQGVDIRLHRKDGDVVTLSVNFNSVMREEEAIVCSFRDVTTERVMEQLLHDAQEQLIDQERQSAIAELAGAAAHELNQPLTIVLGYAELLKRRLEAGTAPFEAANVIFHEAERMAEIVRKIGKITKYETKSYVGESRIVDIDKASASDGTSRPPKGDDL